jgi:FAD-NAD(P)-binding protein
MRRQIAYKTVYTGTIMQSPRHIALIGCGFTGTSAFYQLVENYPVKEITIFEASGVFGPGFPYQEGECPDYLINNITDTMCLAPSNRRAFLNWLEHNREYAPNLDPKGHLPRSVYGAFLKDVFASTLTLAAVKGIAVRLVGHEATSMREDGDGVHIGWEGGDITVDMAILTTGRCPDVGIEVEKAVGARVIQNHIMSDAFDDIAPDATVHVLGASLSAYDVVNRLFSPQSGCRFEPSDKGALKFIPGANERRVVLCSRSGRLKAVTSRAPMAITRKHFTIDALRKAAQTKPLTLDDVADMISLDAKENGVELDWPALMKPYAACRSGEEVNQRAGALLEAAIIAATMPPKSGAANFLVDFAQHALMDIWDAFAENLLSAEAEKFYRAKVETAALCYAAACPVSTAQKLLALHRAGRLRVVRGISDVRVGEGGGFAIHHAHGIEPASTLVNATGGVERRVDSDAQPALIKTLAATGLLAPYARGGAIAHGAAVDMKTFKAAGAKNIYLANMLLWGPGFFTSSAYLMSSIVERLLKAAFEDTNMTTD